MADRVRWGVLGPGGIARRFATGLQAVKDADLVAVGSRAKETADAFGDEFQIPRRHVGYDELANDGEVDVIYVATPHVFHMENTLLCLEAGKAVLCEKPFAMNAAQSQIMIDKARETDLFLMEAMWTHFRPAITKVRELVADGAIGEVRQVKADFCFRGDWNPEARHLNLALGGGGLLDVGVYCIAFAQMVYDREPRAVTGFADLVETGADGQAAMVLSYDDGAFAVLTCAVRTSSPHEAYVLGTEGYIRIPHSFWKSDRLVLVKGDEEEKFVYDLLGNGFGYEAQEVGHCLRAGERESSIMPLEKTMAIQRTMDRLRGQWGLKYPME